MAFIQVCPQYAREVAYYSYLGDTLHVKTMGSCPVPLHRMEDGKKLSKEPGPLVFPSVGRYSVNVWIKASHGRFGLHWDHAAKKNMETLHHQWKEKQHVHELSETVIVFRPGIETGFTVNARDDLEIEHVLVAIEKNI